MPVTAEEYRKRLVDHFKRGYQIIVGLAIALACTKLFPNGDLWTKPDLTFWLFGVFFITVVPIFHGGDRSLDIKYLDAEPTDCQRAWYVWDVFALLITAIIFVKVAQAIPGLAPGLGGGTAPTTPTLFYWWMVYLFIFDLFVLVLDWVKNVERWSRALHDLRAYRSWIGLNAGMAVVCYLAAQSAAEPHLWPQQSVAIGVFGFALARSVLDYCAGREFLFP